MERRLEPELMEGELQAKAYAEADFEASNSQFMGLMRQRFPDFRGGLVLDLGCGPGDIVLRFAREYPEAFVHGVDGSNAMLRYAENALAHAPGLRTRVRFCHGVLPDAVLPERSYDAIISNSLLHHLHDPQVLWRVVGEVGRGGAAICIMDLIRPDSEARAREIVETYSADEPEILKQDFYNSLLAAFSPEEVRGQLQTAGIEGLNVEQVGDRHLLISGRLSKR